MRWPSRALSWALGVVLCACGGGGGDSSGTASVRLIHASVGYPALDFYLDDSLVGGSVAQYGVGEFTAVTSNGVTTAIRNAGGSTSLTSASRSFTAGAAYSIVAYGWQGALKTLQLNEGIAAPSSGYAKLLLLHTAPDAGDLDVYVTASSDDLDAATPLSSGLAGATTSGHYTVSAGSYRLRVTRSGDKTDLRLDVDGLQLTSQQVATLILTPGSGGVLVHGLLVTQQGGAVRLANTQARVRAVGSVAASARVNLALGGQTLLANALSPSIGSYTLVTAGTPAATLTVAGSAAGMATPTLEPGGDYSLLIWGTAAAPLVTAIADDNRLPTGTSAAKLRLVHGVSSLGVPLTLTRDFSVTANGVGEGTASAYATVGAASGARLEVSSPLSIDPLYSVDSVTLASGGLYTVFMLGDSARPAGALRRER